MPEEVFLPFIKKEQVAKDAYSFYFDRPAKAWDFVAGQYMRLTLPVTNPDQRGNSRLFSISSSPLEKDYIMVTTRIIQSAFKKTLFSLTPQAKVLVFGPLGKFVLDENDLTPRIFLAGGIGITPFHSILTYVAAKKLTIPITIFASFSTAEDLIFYNELTTIANQIPSIKIVYTITNLENSQIPWIGETGRISESLIKKYVSDPSVPSYYIAGPPTMVAAMEQLVKDMGVQIEKIRKENFVGY